MVADLRQHRGASLVVTGHRQPAPVHALAHAMNETLGNVGATVELIAPAAAQPVDHAASLRELVDAMRSGAVEALIMTGVNPAYTAPDDLGLAGALAKVPFKVHHGLYVDETAVVCDWHLPAAHELERWGDVKSFDGTVTLQQPCIAPLYDGKSASELLAAVAGDIAAPDRERLRAYWGGQHAGTFDAFFADALRKGAIDGSASAAKHPKLRADAAAATAAAAFASAPSPDDVELVFVADARTGDGEAANNAWLQELPKPLSLLTWDNAALMSAALASRLGIGNEDVVELRLDGRTLSAPAWVMPGMPDRSVTLALGYGRRAAGGVGNGRGANAYALRTSADPWLARGLTIVKTGRRRALASVQTHHSMEGRDIVRRYTLAQAQACTASACGTPEYLRQPTLYESPPTGPYAWAMSIDLSACIGCGACTIACQAENNIAVVGHDEVRHGREMHWIRVDRYYEGPVGDPRTLFQPVPCMQCEHAPCELVCPVEASVHDAQGINVQVYNRCVGTRFCSNNCPYKVRRFNFLQYARDVPGLDAQRNPEVSVRMRGVMEKCNYCLQRITTAKIAADREGRRLADGDVVTACQAVCPTRAIVFGDLADPASEVVRRKNSPLDYALLAELNTRPRTTYLARVTNPSPQLPE
jgi:molybdopterin-containing oxidoreductase family iron-sulfur binding subunit